MLFIEKRYNEANALYKTINVLSEKIDVNELFILFQFYVESVAPNSVIRLNTLNWLSKNLKEIQRRAKYMEKSIKIDRNTMPVFVFWAQGIESAPPIVKRNIERLRNVFGQRLHVLDENTMKYYVETPKIDKISRWCHKADMLRLELLMRYGGTWIDSSIFVKPEFSDIISENSSILAIYSPTNKIMGNWLLSIDEKYNYVYCLQYQALNMYLDLYGDFNEYFMFHTVWHLLAHIDDRANEFWNKSYHFEANKAMKLGCIGDVLLKGLDIDEFNEQFNSSPIHKLTYKYDESKVTLDTTIARLMRMN